MALPFDPSTFLPADASEEEQDIYRDTDNFVGATATQSVGDPLADQGITAALQSGDFAEPIAVTRPQPAAAQPTDPFALNKFQRRMLGFAAMRDAGAALRGEEGSAFTNTLKAFNDQADMQRKARAAQAEMDLRKELIGSIGTGADMGVGGSQLDVLKAQKANLMRQAFANPTLFEAIKLQISDIDKEIERLEQNKAQTQQMVQGADTVMSNIRRLQEEVANNPNTTGLLGSILGAFGFTKAGSLRLDLQTVKANIAFDTLRGIKAGGATLGAVSAPELALLEAKIAQLDMDRPQEDVLRSFREVEEYYQQIIRNAYANADDPAELDRMFTQLGYGGRPEWVNQRSGAATIPTYTMENVPAGELAYNVNDQKVYKFNGGDRQDRNNWSEVEF